MLKNSIAYLYSLSYNERKKCQQTDTSKDACTGTIVVLYWASFLYL